MSTETVTPTGEDTARSENEFVKGNSTGGMIVREFAAELTPGEGRTVDVRIVPYGERITHNDGLGGVARGVDYTEEWMPGVFAHQQNAANRVLANYEHDDRLAGVVGHGVALRDAADGFHGSFVMHDNPDGDKALLLVREGVLGGVSVEAYPVKSERRGGIVQRVKANLRAIALTRFPAYQGARVLAVREEPVVMVWDEQLLPSQLSDEVVDRCRRLGIRLPQRYEAHPDNPGTPDDSGTPDELGTRQDGDNSDLEG